MSFWDRIDQLGSVVTDVTGDVIRAAGQAEAQRLTARGPSGAEAMPDMTPVGTPSGPQAQVIMSAWQQMRLPLMLGGLALLILIIWMAVR